MNHSPSFLALVKIAQGRGSAHASEVGLQPGLGVVFFIFAFFCHPLIQWYPQKLNPIDLKWKKNNFAIHWFNDKGTIKWKFIPRIGENTWRNAGHLLMPPMDLSRKRSVFVQRVWTCWPQQALGLDFDIEMGIGNICFGGLSQWGWFLEWTCLLL